MSEPPIPALVVGCVHHLGLKVTLALVRVHSREEGSCILEVPASEHDPGLTEYGGWSIKESIDATVLDVDLDDTDHIPDFHRCLDSLMSDIAIRKNALGIDAFVPQGEDPS